MRTALTENSEIVLHEIDTLKEYKFSILETVGMGASCIVYTSVFTDAENNQFFVRLKECYPSELKIVRNRNQELIISDKEAFRKELQHFTDGYKRQMKFRTYPESMNSISNIQGIFEGNNTKYIAMSCQNSTRFEKTELNLYDSFRVLKSVTLQIQNFHNNGWLYLDLKPENILLYPETPELIMLFDFDSALQIGEIQAERLSFTKSWSAPEVVQRKISKIGICSDIYSIGALLMYMLFGRTPEVSDRRSSASWESDFGNCILSKESPEVKRMVTDLLKHTICTDIKSRYSSCREILDVIEPFVKSFQKQKPYLKTSLPIGNNYFCGRDREISEIHEILQENNFLILHGIGGIGKSELSKHYAKAFSGNYDAVIFVRYHESIIKTFADDLCFHVEHLQRSENESDEEYFRRKIEILKTVCTPKHLIILDNFDTEECENLDELTSLPCKFLITSRTDFEDIFPQYEVDILDDFNDLRAMFRHYSKQDTNEDSDNIIIALEGHTMAVELVSKQMKLYDISSKDMYEKLCEQGISANKGKVKNLKDGTLRNRNALNHIEILFSVFNLSDNLKKILKHIALIGSVQIDKMYFICICGFSEDEIEFLDMAICGGWIQLYDTDLYIHPLISEALCSQLETDSQSCEKMLLTLTKAAECINSFRADYRFLHEQILMHIGENLSGENQITMNFYYILSEVCENLYDYENAELYLLKVINWYKKENIRPDAFEYARLAYLSDLREDETNSSFYAENIGKFFDDDYSLWQSRAVVSVQSGDFRQLEQNALNMEKYADFPSEFICAYYFMMIAASNLKDEICKQYAYQGLQYAEDALCEDLLTEERALLYFQISELYFFADDFEKCISFAEKSLSLQIEISNSDFVITICNTLCEAYLKLQNYEKVSEYFEKGIQCIENYYDVHHPKRLENYHVYYETWLKLSDIYDDDYCAYYCDILAEKIDEILK